MNKPMHFRPLTEQEIKEIDWTQSDGFLAMSPDCQILHYVTETGPINIRALPDLLKACKELVADFDPDGEYYEKIYTRACNAIVKAEDTDNG